LDTENDFNCYKNFFVNKLQICPKYFKHSFDSFVLKNYTTKFVEKESQDLKQEAHIILDNSLSKEDLGIFDDTNSDWQNTLNFTLKSFEDYSGQVTAGKIFEIF